MRTSVRTSVRLILASLPLGTAMLVPPSVAWSQSAPTGPAQGSAAAAASGDELAEVVVTGTRIRGVEQVGSSSITLSPVDIQNTGLSSTADVLQQYPQLLSLGAGLGATGAGTDAQGETLDNTLARAVNIRGVGREATLSLVDGHRIPYSSPDMAFFDPDALPVQMLQRVEVVADGTSPIYGADAVAGTVNYILRKPFTGAETYGQYGSASGENQWQATQLFGLSWDRDASGFVVAYQHTHQGALAADNRPYYSDNFVPFGGPPSSAYSTPGNVIVNGVSYAIPHGQNGTALTLAELGAAGSLNTQNAWYDAQALPDQVRNSFTFNGNEKVNDVVNIFSDAYYTKREFTILAHPANGQYFVPNSNPFSPCNNTTGAAAALIAACGTGGLTVDYSFANSVSNLNYGSQETYYGFGGVQISLPARWEVTLQAGSGHDEDYTNAPNSSVSAAPGTPLAAALASASAASAYNMFCDGTAYTCNPVGSTKGFGSNFYTQTLFNMSDYEINADGPVFALPGGDLRLAVGGEYNSQAVRANNSFGMGNLDTRDITSGFFEAYVPIVGAANAMPLIRSLQLDLAGRIDSFHDSLVSLGSTKNPKIGIDWTPVDGLKLHGSYGSSFRAPSMLQEDVTAQHGYIALPSFGGVTVACAGCNFPGALLPIDVGYHTTEASTAHTWSFGFDWAPSQIAGLTAAVNWYRLRYENDVDTPLSDIGYVNALNSQQFNSLFVYNPTYFPALAANNPAPFVYPNSVNAATCSAVIGKRITTQALFNSYVACLNAHGDVGFLGPPQSAANIIAIADAEHINSTSINTNGLDISVSEAWSNAWGNWRVGLVAEDALSYDVSLLPGAPSNSYLNDLGFPLRFKGRVQIGWQRNFDRDSLAANLFINYTNGYSVPLGDLPAGVGSQYGSVSAYTTVDLSIIYNMHSYLPQLIRDGVTLSLSVQDLLDTKPPLVVNAASTGNGVLYDPSNASPLQRLIQLQIGMKF
ncbi:MAG TPA: TonB-dependent receptor [Steroidobacteraceae bacterium]|nr:TonB-dependent receptor [Steroidobacteraceae bacterium]